MKNKSLRRGLIPFTILVLIFVSLVVVQAVQARETHRILSTSLTRIQVPQPGDLVHYSYKLYQRTPPGTLEPTDPYHLPYSKIWREVSFENTWLEIANDGKTQRWRTILRDADGDLLQDLMFDGESETDYFPMEYFAEKYTADMYPFTDERVALIEGFLNDTQLERRDGSSLDGTAVVSVYAREQSLDGMSWATQSVEEALLNQSQPFVADLHPVKRAIRIDFSLTTFEPVGQAVVVWDKEGLETVVSYRSYSYPEIIVFDSTGSGEFFSQEIPPEAFADARQIPIDTAVAGLEQIHTLVEFQIYVIPESVENWNLVASSFSRQETSPFVPKVLQNVDYADSLGKGVRLTYSSGDSVVVLVEGNAAELGSLLRLTPPSWTHSEYSTISIGDAQASVWQLFGADPDQIRLVIALGEMLIYVDSRSVSFDELQALLKALQPFD
ncbi:MAG: hypothetical protein WD751_09780 [Anaerolineales bacterium]